MMPATSAAVEAAVDAHRDQKSIPCKRRRSMRGTAAVFDVSRSTMSDRVSGRHLPRHEAHAHRQLVTAAEEEVLVDYICRMASYGFPASPSVIRDVANLIRQNRLLITSSPTHQIVPLGKNWIEKFKSRHPEVRSAWTKAMHDVRVDGCQPHLLRKWFNEIQAIMSRNLYRPENIYNMDKTGYGIGGTQSKQVLVVVDKRDEDHTALQSATGKATRRTKGRADWMTAIECVSASGRALPPLMIFKGKGSFNNYWLPEGVDIEGWQWWTSHTGWTNALICLNWLRNQFDPLTTPATPGERRLLIVDGHNSHVTAAFIGYCLVRAIDIMVLPPHSSHMTQPLDVGIFRPLKRHVGTAVDDFSMYVPGALSKKDWATLIATGRVKAMTQANIVYGWRQAGLWPLNPHKLVQATAAPSTPPRHNSPIEGTPLATVSSENRDFLRANPSLKTPTKNRLISMSSSLESVQGEKAVLERENEILRAMAKPPKQVRKGMTVSYLGTHEFTTDDVLAAAKEAETSRKGKNAATKEPDIFRGTSPPVEEGPLLRQWIINNVDA